MIHGELFWSEENTDGCEPFDDEAAGKIILVNSQNCTVNHKLSIAEEVEATALILISEHHNFEVRRHRIDYQNDTYDEYDHNSHYKSRIPALLIENLSGKLIIENSNSSAPQVSIDFRDVYQHRM